jgi:nucleoid-associated protein YgaU
MAKQPLNITALSAGNGQRNPSSGSGYELQINPSEFSHEYTICYNAKRTLGQTSNPLRFSAMNPDKISFGVVFDGTGVVPPQPGTPVEVADQIDALGKVIYDYSSEQHEPNVVQITWGTLLFTGRLQSMSVNYTLFRPTGAPLRARAELVFIGSVTTDEALLAANRSSPDLSHSVLVVEGDTLPLLCLRIYGDSRYYPEVAAFNGLREFRRLKTGSRLHFPPLR